MAKTSKIAKDLKFCPSWSHWWWVTFCDGQTSKTRVNLFKRLGYCNGHSDRAVASNTRGPRFESMQHRQLIFIIYLQLKKTKNKGGWEIKKDISLPSNWFVFQCVKEFTIFWSFLIFKSFLLSLMCPAFTSHPNAFLGPKLQNFSPYLTVP